MPTKFPYPGLRPFHQDEADIFFGREEQVDELLKKLSRTRFLAVVGTSGCGKSSLVKAGMIPALETGFMVEAGTRWEISVMRPGSNPLKRLVDALMSNAFINREGTGEHTASFLEATLRRGPLGIIKALQESPLPKDTNLLIVVDQFEELFRLRNDSNRDIQDAFMALLLETVRQQDIPIYVVITMRSDYLGDCVLFPGLPEALNESQYLTPRMTRAQRKSAIVGPARVFGGEIEPLLLNRLLNETGADPNKLPVLQHLLMRMWDYTKSVKTVTTKINFMEQVASETMGHVLSVSDYEKVGGIANALSNHADEAYGSLDDEKKRIAKILFQNLCERGEGSRDGRHPTELKKIVARAGAETKDVIEVVEMFRKSTYGFIVPSSVESIYETTVLDISHESLINQWKKLKRWVNQEAKSVETYKFLELNAQKWKKGKAALWGTLDIESALNWKKSEQPSAAWAERYGGDFDLAMKFLNASSRQKKRKEYRRKMISVLSSALVLLFGGIIVWKWCTEFREHTAYFNTFKKVYGVPVGVGKLEDKQVSARSSSYKLTRKGSEGKVQKMIVVGSNFKPTNKHKTEKYFEYSSETKNFTRECQYEYIYDNDGNLVSEKAYDKYGKLLGSFNYFSREKTKSTVYGHFVGPLGFSRINSNSSAEYIKFKYTSKGYESERHYSNRNGDPKPDKYLAYSQKREYNEHGLPSKLVLLDQYDEIVRNNTNNTNIRYKYDTHLHNLVDISYLDENNKSVRHRYGFAGMTSEYDENGNLKRRVYFDTNRKPMKRKGNYAGWTSEYNEKNNTIRTTYFDENNVTVTHTQGYAVWEAKYDKEGNEVEKFYFDENNLSVKHKDNYVGWTAKYENSNQINITYYDKKIKHILDKHGFASMSSKYDEYGNKVGKTFLDRDGNPIAGWIRKFDKHGNKLLQSHYNAEGMLHNTKKGFAKYIAKYNWRNKKVEEIYYDKYMRLVAGGLKDNRLKNCARMVYIYGNSDITKTKECYDKNNVLNNISKMHDVLKDSLNMNSYIKIFK